MFFNTFLNMACDMQLLTQSRNNNNRPNKKNDVITDLGGEGNFPMFRFGPPTSSHLTFHLTLLQRHLPWRPAAQWMPAP